MTKIEENVEKQRVCNKVALTGEDKNELHKNYHLY